MNDTPTRAAIWARVSTEDQATANQVAQLRQLAEHRGWEVVQVYETEASAWNGAHRAALDAALDAAHRGEYQVLLVWAIDRLSREGVEATFKVVRQLSERGVAVVSLQEPWLNGSTEVQELMLAISAWMARQESQRRSERIKAGIARRRAAGLHVGRKAGARDSKPRKRSGYHRRWERERGQ